jgi:hypothetical protein
MVLSCTACTLNPYPHSVFNTSENRCETRDIDLGVYVPDLPIAKLPVSTVLHFTFYWPTAGRWEGADFTVEVTTPPAQHRQCGRW